MSSELGSAFVRIRPDLSSFRRETQAGVRGAFRDLGTLHVPGLGGVRQEFASIVAPAREAGAAATSSLRQIRSARDQTARDSVAASLRERRALEQEIVAYRRLAVDATVSGRAQRQANLLAAQSAERLGIELTHVERKAIGAAGGLNKLERGALAGSGAMRGMGRNIAFASLSFIGAYGFVNAVRSSIEAASDLNTQQVRAETVFGRSGAAVRKWSKDQTRDLGFSRESVLNVANAFGTLLRSVDLLPARSSKYAEDFTRVAAAISLGAGEADPSRATSALQGALIGRGRLLKQYGIVLDNTVLKAKAAELGILRTKVDPAKIAVDQRKLVEANIALGEARAKGASPLVVARAEDVLASAERKLRKDLAGTTAELTKGQKAIAAHAAVMEQGQRFIDRYGAALETGAGRSRRFHEGISEIKEELGTALYPEFARVTDGIISYIHEISEGGARHEEFQKDLHDIADAAHVLYGALKLVAGGVQGIADVVGGVGNLVEILAFAYLANKALVFAAAIRESRLALFLLGEQAPATAAAVVTAEAEMGAGALTLSGRLAGLATRFGAIAAAIIGLQVLTDKSDGRGIFDKIFGEFEGKPGIGPLGVADKLLEDLGLSERARDRVRRGTADILTFGAAEIPRALFGFGERAKPKEPPLPSAVATAKRLRKANYGEAVIYRFMRQEGYTRRQTTQAIVQTREHPGGVTLPPSPEDVRVGDIHATTTASETRGLASRQIKHELGTLAKEIESGEKITTARARTLSHSLASVMAEIADSGFGPARRRTLTTRVRQLAVELAQAAGQIGDSTVAELRKSRREIRSELDEIGREIALARGDMARSISEAIRGAAEAERDAVSQAKSNLNSLGQSLSDFINRFVDAQDEKAQQAPSGPLAARLKALYELIREGRATPQLIAEAKRVEHELNEQSSKTAEDSSKRKERITTGLADLTDQLNTGKIGLAKFNREVTKLLAREGISYKAAGKTLGIAFADGFQVALKDLRAQAAALIATPSKLRGKTTGFEAEIVRPLAVIKEQNANIAEVERTQHERLRELIRRRHELLLKEQQNANKIAREQRARTNALLALRGVKTPEPSRDRPDRSPARDTGRDRPPARRREVVGHGPDPLEGANRRRVVHSSLRVDVKADDKKAHGELERISSFFRRTALTVAFEVHRAAGDNERTKRNAHAGGREIGVSLSTGIEEGISSRVSEIARSARRAVLHMIREAKRAAKIGSPSQLTYDEIGVPLGQGIERALQDGRDRLGDALAGQIRTAILRGRREAFERENAPQRPGPVDKTAFPRSGSTAVATAPHLREAQERTIVRKGVDLEALAQRDLLLREERKHTVLLKQIAQSEGAQVVLLRDVDRALRAPGRKRDDGDKNPRRATEAGHAAARNNLLG